MAKRRPSMLMSLKKISCLLAVFIVAAMSVPVVAGTGFAPKPPVKPVHFIPAPEPRPAVPEGGALIAEDDALYRRIFAAQERGDMKAADRLMRKAGDQRLMGYVLYQRYMHPSAYTSKFKELKGWLARYADHPNAGKIYDLAVRKAGSDEQVASLRRPVKRTKVATRTEPTMVKKKPYHLTVRRTAMQVANGRALGRKVEALLRKKRYQSAIEVLDEADRRQSVLPQEIDYWKAKVAAKNLYDGRTDVALALCQQAYKRSGAQVPLSGWVCGLVSWYGRYYSHAAHYFEGTAQSDYASGWMQSSAAYWTARSFTRLGKRKAVRHWLEQAAAHPRTFYGLLAKQAARDKLVFDWNKLKLTDDMRAHLADIASGARALALLDAGQKDWAEQELIHINARSRETREAMLALALEYDLPALSIRLGSLLNQGEGRFHDAALFPDVSHKDRGLYKIDPALIHAIARQESRFDVKAESRSGARGLMQIMPKTARYVADKHGVQLHRIDDLLQPDMNLNLGQHYVRDLLKHPNVKGDLVSMIIAYNAGPGNLGKWKRLWGTVDDTLLFIELIGSAQARGYVEKVMANYWIYRLKQGRDLPTLEALAKGNAVTYALASEDLPYKVAQGK